MKRKPGYYWVLQRNCREYEVAQWSGKEWFFVNSSEREKNDSMFESVLPDRIKMPTDEETVADAELVGILYKVFYFIDQFNVDRTSSSAVREKVADAAKSIKEYLNKLL